MAGFNGSRIAGLHDIIMVFEEEAATQYLIHYFVDIMGET
jgi:hypothetical protein